MIGSVPRVTLIASPPGKARKRCLFLCVLRESRPHSLDVQSNRHFVTDENAACF